MNLGHSHNDVINNASLPIDTGKQIRIRNPALYAAWRCGSIYAKGMQLVCQKSAGMKLDEGKEMEIWKEKTAARRILPPLQEAQFHSGVLDDN